MKAARSRHGPTAASLTEVWGQALQAFACSSCQHSFVADKKLRLQGRCPWCGHAGGLSRSRAQLREEPPEWVVRFALDRAEVASRLEGLVDQIPSYVRPDDLKAEELRDRLQVTYFPVWLVDSDVVATWKCEVGLDYDVKTHREKWVNNSWQSHEVKRAHIDWEPREGTFARTIDNVATPALSEHKALLRSLGDFDLRAAEPYQAEMMKGSIVMLPNLNPEEAWREAEAGFRSEISEQIQAACQAQHLEKLELKDDHQEKNWTMRLLPVWTTWYRSDDEKTQVLRIQGQRGDVSGALVASAKKGQRWALTIGITAAVLLLAGLGVPQLGGFFRTWLVLFGLIGAVFTSVPLKAAKRVVRLSPHC